MPEVFGTNEVGTAVRQCPPQQRPKPLHWIEIELVGEDDKPIRWEEYQVVLPGGETVRGYLDGDGFARIDPIEQAGACKVAFPAIDQDAWTFIESTGPK